MKKSKILILALAAIYTLTFTVGCSLAADAKIETVQSGNDEPTASVADIIPAADNGEEDNYLFSPNQNVESSKGHIESMAEDIIKNVMSERIGDDPAMSYYGEYSIDMIQQMGNNIFAVVGYYPNEGQGDVTLYVLERDADNLVVVETTEGNLPISSGVTVFKFVFSNITVVYGALNDELWYDLSEAPEKAVFTEVKVQYSNGKEQSAKVGNFQTFMVCIDGDVPIDEIQLLSGNEVIGEYFKLYANEKGKDNFNAHGTISYYGKND